MAKQIWKALDNLSPSDVKLTNLPRKPDGLYNLKVNEYGQLVKRAGYAKHNTDAILPADGSKITGMHRYYKQNTSDKKFLVAWYKKIYELPDNGGTAVALTDCPDLGPNADTYFADFLNTCYMLNGLDGVFKYNITRFGTVGVTVPAVKPTGAASGTDGSLGVGNYKFCYTYVDLDGYEGNPSPVSDDIDVESTEHVTLTMVNSGDLKKRIYRTSVNGVIYYYDGEVDKDTATYNSTQADNTLGKEVKYNHTAPEATSHLITKRRNKLYLAYNDYLYPSHTTYVEYFPPLWRQRTGNSQKITGLLEQLIALPVFTDDSVERLVGTDEDDFNFKNSYSTEGNIAIRSLVNCDNPLVYLGFNGINYFDGVSSGIFSKAVNEYIKANINGTYRHLSCATYWDDKYLLCYPKGTNTLPSETIWIDLKNKTYGVYDFAFSCFSKWDRGTDGLRLFGGSNTIGRVYEIGKSTILTDYNETTEADDAITAYDSPEPIDLGYPELWKQFYHIYIKVKSTTVTNTTVDADSSGTVLNVASTTGFSAGGFIVINEGGAREETKVIASIQAGISLTMTEALTYTHTAVQADTVVTPLRFYYTLDDASETYKDLTLTAEKTLWYKVDLVGGGQRARAIRLRPYISDKYDFTIMGYAVVFELEPPEYA